MQPEEAGRFGEEIFDPEERRRWCGAVLAGGLPYLWTHKARVPRKLAIDQLELRPGDRVYVNGEALEPTGVPDEIREAIGPDGEVVIDDFMEEVRQIAWRGVDPKWEWEFTRKQADESFDAVLCLQGVAHAGDWKREGTELVRILKPGRQLVLGEISFGTSFKERVAADLHIEYYFEKLFDGIGLPFYLPSWEIDDVREELTGVIEDVETFSWRGVDLLWGRKPS
jgi:SAM-dependent methyltransferase